MPALRRAPVASDLADYLTMCRAAAPVFDWRTWHCARFVAGWVRWRTGLDFWESVPQADSLAGWVRVLRARGGLQAMVTVRLGLPVAPTLARVGGVLLMHGDMTGGALAVCAGRTAVALDEAGRCVHVPTSTARQAWHLPGELA